MSTAPSFVIPHLERLVGDSQISSDAAALASYEIDGKRPACVVYPRAVEEVAAVVRFAVAEKLALIPTGGRSKLRIGAIPARYDLAMDMGKLDRVLAYDAGDLTVGVQPGVRCAELNRVLAEQKQFLPLAPAFGEAATIGGVVAANSISPLRYGYGSARDFVLGMEIVTGYGAIAKSGGSVVKNVTGYDLQKLMVGSYGTLGVITRVNFKTFPLPPAQQTFVAKFPEIEQALVYTRAIRQSALEPRMVELLDAESLRIIESDGDGAGGERTRPGPAGWTAVVAVAGKAPVVERHAKDLAKFADQARVQTFATLTEGAEMKLLGNVREYVARVLDACSEAIILRINTLPATISGIVRKLCEVGQRHGMRSACLVRAGGIVYYALLPKAGECGTNDLKITVNELTEAAWSEKGSEAAMIEWCPVALKAEINILGRAGEDVGLMRRVKDIFDPHGIMSPGRFTGGI